MITGVITSKSPTYPVHIPLAAYFSYTDNIIVLLYDVCMLTRLIRCVVTHSLSSFTVYSTVLSYFRPYSKRLFRTVVSANIPTIIRFTKCQRLTKRYTPPTRLSRDALTRSPLHSMFAQYSPMPCYVPTVPLFQTLPPFHHKIVAWCGNMYIRSIQVFVSLYADIFFAPVYPNTTEKVTLSPQYRAICTSRYPISRLNDGTLPHNK